MKKRCFRYWGALSLALCMASVPPCAGADENKEYLIKAAFLYNFLKFAEWPEGKGIASQTHVDICVLGDSPISKAGAVFKEASNTKTSLSLVEEKSAKAAAEHCHILFVSQSEEARLPDIFAALKDKPVLTVSDMDKFAEQGGMIGFVMADNKVKLVVNTKSVTASNMRIDAQLLDIALKVIRK